MRALQRLQPPHLELLGLVAQGLDQLRRALVPVAPRADAAVDDLLEVIRAAEAADLLRAEAVLRRPLDEHADELANLVDVVPRLPFRGRGVADLARDSPGIERAGLDAPPVARVPDD